MSDEKAAGPQLTSEPREPVRVIKGPDFRPVGMVIPESKLSEAEKRILLAQGWDGASDVPTNMPDMLEASGEMQQRIAAASQALPPGFKMPEKDLDVSSIEVVELDELPADMLEKFRNVTAAAATSPPKPTNNAFEAARQRGMGEIKEAASNPGLHPDILNAVQSLAAEEPELIPTEKKSESIPTEKASANKAAATSEAAYKPPAPSLPLTIEEQIQRRVDSFKRLASEDDKQNFATAIFGGYAFMKTYSLMGGKVSVTFREPQPADEEQVQQQLQIDQIVGRAPAKLASATEQIERYNLATTLQAVRFDGQDKARFEVPATTPITEYIRGITSHGSFKVDGFEAGDLAIRGWSQFIRNRALAGSLHALVKMKYQDFSELLVGLRMAAKDDDFFGNPTSQP